MCLICLSAVSDVSVERQMCVSRMSDMFIICVRCVSRICDMWQWNIKYVSNYSFGFSLPPPVFPAMNGLILGHEISKDNKHSTWRALSFILKILDFLPLI